MIQFLFFNILTKLYYYNGVRGKYFDFLCNLYILHLKHVLDLLQCYQMNFLLKEVFRQGCLLSPILFNLFINDIQNDCEKYGINIGRKKKCRGGTLLLMMLFSQLLLVQKKKI